MKSMPQKNIARSGRGGLGDGVGVYGLFLSNSKSPIVETKIKAYVEAR